MILVYHDGTWQYLYGKQIFHNGAWYTLKAADMFRHLGSWHLIGEPEPYTSDQYGSFPVKVGLKTYECTADETIDPDTGDPVYTNWRWQLISTETAERAPGLENPAEYPQWRYYTAGEQGQSPFDFSVEVDTTTGHIIGVGADVHNGQLAAPPPPAAGPDYYMDTVTFVYATR